MSVAHSLCSSTCDRHRKRTLATCSIWAIINKFSHMVQQNVLTCRARNANDKVAVMSRADKMYFPLFELKVTKRKDRKEHISAFCNVMNLFCSVSHVTFVPCPVFPKLLAIQRRTQHHKINCTMSRCKCNHEERLVHVRQ